jgi:DNA-binding LacI/PurR family transcriptional regulator/serine phosphatase RsbU (regulator of sigma subunit)
MLIDYYGGDYQLGLIQGAEETTKRSDNNMVVAVGRWLNSPKPIDSIQNDIFHHLKNPGTDGIVVASGCLSHYVSQEELAQFVAKFAPLPVISISVQVPGVPSLIVDNRRGQQQIVDHLIESHGARRIAYIRGPAASFEAAERLDGYKDALRIHGIDFEPSLVIDGNFWVDSGKSSVERLLDDGVTFDSLVAANDYMALGAMEGLKSRGLRIPQDVRLVGFDDAPVARMGSPSLTTVRQPLQRMGALAIELLNQKLDGKSVADVYSLDVELVRRQSCGCGYGYAKMDSTKFGKPVAPLNVAGLTALRERLQEKTLSAICVYSEFWPSIVKALIDALLAEFDGNPGKFLAVLFVQLELTKKRVDILDQFYNVVVTLRAEVLSSFSEANAIEDLCHSALLMVSEWINRVQMRALYDQDIAAINLRASIERLSTVLTNTALSEALEAVLPAAGIRSACLSLYDEGSTERLRTFAIAGVANAVELRGCQFEPNEIVPAGFCSTERCQSFVLMPLSHGDVLYGQALLEAGEQFSVYTMLREQIGALLKTAELHRTVVEETSRRERAERERLESETQVAQQIQTAILPDHLDVPGLVITAVMRPATTVGGDYYDVIPIDDGCFIGIGDVTGHGLLAGMIMMMVQSMVTATIRSNPERYPSQILPPINRALYDNIRHRLHGTDHVTLTLIKYRNDGKLFLAGAHDEPLIWRKSTGKCSRVSPPGFWLGAVAEVEEMTTDLELQLEDGDKIVLYTDGITEAMNASHEQFGLGRLTAVVERYGSEPPATLSAAVLHALSNWTSTQIDDISLLVAQYDVQAMSATKTTLQ